MQIKIGDNGEVVELPLKEYEGLLKDSNFMRALEAAGVDNWEGFGTAIDIYEDRHND